MKCVLKGMIQYIEINFFFFFLFIYSVDIFDICFDLLWYSCILYPDSICFSYCVLNTRIMAIVEPQGFCSI